MKRKKMEIFSWNMGNTERTFDEKRLTKNVKKSKNKYIDKFRKPCYSYRDDKIIGNCITIDQPKDNNGQPKEVDYIVMQVKCDKPVRFCMSISYWNERNDKFNPNKDEVFSDEIKEGLFGSLDKVDEAIMELSRAKKARIKDTLEK